MRAKTHGWWLIPVVAGVLGIGWGWIQSVNAKMEDVALLKDAVPRLEKNVDTIVDKIDETNQRLSNIEGRLGRTR